MQAKTETAGREALLKQQVAARNTIIVAQQRELALYRQAGVGTGTAAGAGRLVIGSTGAVRSSVGSSGTAGKTQRNENDTSAHEADSKWGPAAPPAQPVRDEHEHAQESEVKRKSRPVRRAYCTCTSLERVWSESERVLECFLLYFHRV